MTIKNETELRQIYAVPKGRAKVKVFKTLDKHSTHFIHCSPFIVLSTVGKNGALDASPRGGQAGFVKILNDETLLIPDFKGNNRVDSLTNIVETASIGILFLIPGIDETLRLNGKAIISTSQEYISHFSDQPKLPISCIVVSIEEVFLHCAKAFMRSKLWDSSRQLDPANFPSLGQMLNDQLNETTPSESREAMVKRYLIDL